VSLAPLSGAGPSGKSWRADFQEDGGRFSFSVGARRQTAQTISFISDGAALPRRRYGWRVAGFGFADVRPANPVVRIRAFLFGRWAIH
jgi:hypothetical protein